MMIYDFDSFRPRPRNTAIDQLLGDRLARRRVEQGLSQTELARRLDITAQQLERYEAGAERISATRLFHFSKALDYPLAELFADFAPQAGGPPKH